MEIEFWFDVVCPFAYLASARIEQVADEAGATVRWRPTLLGGLLKTLGGPADPNAAQTEAKRRFVRQDMRRQAAWLGVPLRLPDAHPRRTLDAMRLLCAVPDDAVRALAERLFAAYWLEGRDVADRGVLREIAGRDIDRLVDDPETKRRLHASTAEAAARGIFGVPTFAIGEQRIWGVDRLRFVRRILGLPEDRRLPSFVERSAGPVDWFHDFSSPFSYLASTRLAEIPQPIVPRPVLVGGLFQALQTPLVPLHTYTAAKQAWVHSDFGRWAEALAVPFRFPTRFPIRSVVALRVALLEPAVTHPIYRAAWADDRDVTDPEILRRILDEAGFDGARLLAAAGHQDVKDRLRSETDQARESGVFGVPTFRVDGELFFGQDRVHQVALAARGWRVDA